MSCEVPQHIVSCVAALDASTAQVNMRANCFHLLRNQMLLTILRSYKMHEQRRPLSGARILYMMIDIWAADVPGLNLLQGPQGTITAGRARTATRPPLRRRSATSRGHWPPTGLLKTSCIVTLEAQLDAVHIDLMEPLRVERSVADTKHSVQEELFSQHGRLTINKLNDMAGCLQDRVEHRLSELHATLHKQIYEAHVRVGARKQELNALKELHDRAEARAAQLGVVISFCIATSRSLSARVEQT